jgi:ATP/maltotriose-dependent transcriptional regulator MalT
MALLDLRRATEWTDALEDWCSTQSESAPFRGVCLVHRAEILRAHGAWEDAIEAAERARQRLAEIRHPAVGLAWYQLGELHRLRGAREQAEAAYDSASSNGRDPTPGLALLRESERRYEVALTTIDRMLEEHRDSPARAAMLAAAVDVRLGAGDVDAARAASDELDAIARPRGFPLLTAMAAYARGSVMLAEGDARGALPELRAACEAWRRLEMPYEAARARAQIAHACAALGDRDASTRELDAARVQLEQLGARPDLERLDAEAAERRSVPLTDRECEVLRLVATGRTNREIAADLFVSEHTVGRHLQNIFKKIDVSSRAAATAYAYEHDLV